MDTATYKEIQVSLDKHYMDPFFIGDIFGTEEKHFDQALNDTKQFLIDMVSGDEELAEGDWEVSVVTFDDVFHIRNIKSVHTREVTI